MYPLKTIIISRDDEVLPEIRRELHNARAEIDSCYPDVASVVEHVSLSHDEMRLFIVHLDSIDDLAALKHLSGVYVGRPVLAVVDGNPSVPAIVHAMREGATQVVLVPFQADDFDEALQSIETQFGHAVGKSRLIAVTGSHGGAGATTLSVNLAYEIAQTFELDCILLELSSSIGVLSACLNIESRHTTRDLLEIGEDLDAYILQHAMVQFGERLSVLPGPFHAAVDFKPSPVARQRLIQCARQLADVVIVDVPPTLDNDQFEILDVANEVVLVGEQTVPSIQMTSESLRLGIRAHSPIVVINKFDANLEGFGTSRLASILKTDRLRTISDDRTVVNASINSGRPLRMIASHSPALSDIDALAEDLVGKPRRHHHRSSLLRNLFTAGASMFAGHDA